MPAKEIIAENFAPSQWLSWPRSSIRVVDWNIDRGLELRSIIDFLGDANADILILQEVDLNARRTHRLNVAQEIARKLRLNYVFGREFVELTQGSNASPAYHGQATLSRWEISNSRLIRFREQSNFWKPRWYVPKLEPFQERLGGRIALVSEINMSGASIVSYNLHLESRANDQLRLAQLDEVLKDARAYKPAHLMVIAGDLNLNASDTAPAEAISRAGFTHAVPISRLATTPARHLLEPGRHIDWAFVRGPVQIDRGRVHNSIKASDHYPISFEIGLSSGH
ncbi:endonuclease/exonuclease/phosphatase family protein [Edaphobacter modestus]|uniref:Endonuclease/exonuclease/phosphatase family metal-dependent hydrolase n=1 Tax=Edaphobacter modestus TaxID=388466 RepID=A0A4Q7YEM1_9BACT|nr:endonuclease/exonuclease/phosphatase family protein [Edaphobacter modestus]RZU35600.1 endonuclease/exonuclease/phosphatase family metal-dependent hydrolase [Edaphobacter modestus]